MCNDAMAVRIDEYGGVLVRSEKANVELWMDVWEENGEMHCDWNKYIFFLTDERDLRDRAFQQDSDNFEAFSNAAINFITKA